MIADLVDAAHTLAWALAAWITVLAALGTILVLAAAAAGAWTVKALRRRPTGPSWRRGRLRARIHARQRVRPPQARTDDPTYDEAA